MRKALLISYDYPPVVGSSGVHRTLSFSRYLPQNGWEIAVLTVPPRAYVRTAAEESTRISPGTRVVRAFAVDSARHLAVRSRYPRFLAVPDRWASWWLGAVPAGLALIRRWKPDVIWSTYPIATAHLIGLTLHRLSGLPWVADCRDFMTDQDYPVDPTQRRAFQRIERAMVNRAAAVVLTTPGTLRMYAERYTDQPASHWHCIANGYDEESFELAASDLQPALPGRPLKLVHSGVLYPFERDPGHFFAALSELKARRVIEPGNVEIVLRATGHDAHVSRLIEEYGVESLVRLEAGIPYRAALAEMLQADALLLFQGTNFNRQIPAKLYEYMRTGRPIFSMTDSCGDTASALRSAGIDSIVPIDDSAAIAKGLREFLRLLAEGKAAIADPGFVSRFSRPNQAKQLARLFEAVVAKR